MDRQGFLSECRKWLSDGDIKRIEGAALGNAAGSDGTPVLRAWREFDKNLRSELAEARILAKSNRRDRPALSIKGIWEQPDPLLIEQAFERFRWEYLDSLEAGNFFDINFLILYYIKLQIIERLSHFNKEIGEGVFQDMCEVKYE